MIAAWYLSGYVVVACVEVGAGIREQRNAAHDAIDNAEYIDLPSSVREWLHRDVDTSAPSQIVTSDGFVVELRD